MPTNRRFIAVPFCFPVSEMDVNKGEGMHINPFSHPFHSSKRLRLQWRDQGYKATDNPPNTAKSSTNSQAMPPPSCRLKLIHKICGWTSCLLSDKLLKTSEAAPPSQRSQLLLSNRVFIVGYNVEGGQCLSAGLPCSLHTWCTSCHLLSYFFILPPPPPPPPPTPPSLLSYTAVAGRRNISRQRNTAMPSNTLSLLISLSQMQMCCTLLFASRPFRLGKCVLKSVGNPKKREKKVSEKSMIKSDKTCSCCSESFSPL